MFVVYHFLCKYCECKYYFVSVVADDGDTVAGIGNQEQTPPTVGRTSDSA